MKKFSFFGLCVLAASLGLAVNSYAEESVAEKVETNKNKTIDTAKSTYRAAEDEVCEIVNGKMKCIGKKIKHSAENTSDKLKTKGTELKNKIE